MLKKEQKGNKGSGTCSGGPTEEEELAQEKKKYMEVSGLAAIQEKERKLREEPTPKKSEIEEEVKKGMNSLPKYAMGNMSLKQLKKEMKES